LLSLQVFEDPVEDPVFRPAIHPGIDRMPVAELSRQSPPLAAMFGHIEDGVEHLQVRHAHVAALHRQDRGNALVLRFGEFHP
jgi:hypothetical protein